MSFHPERRPWRSQHGLLAGRAVAVTIKEPWEFATENGTGPFVGEIVTAAVTREASDGTVLLLRLRGPLLYQGSVCEYFVAAPRSFGDDLGAISLEQSVNCSLLRTSEQAARSRDPFDLAWWRNGEPLVGSLRAI